MKAEGMKAEDARVENVRSEGLRMEDVRVWDGGDVRMEDVRVCIPPHLLTPPPAHLCGGVCCQQFFLHVNHLVSNDHPPLGFLL